MPIANRRRLVELTIAGLCFVLVMLFRFFMPVDAVTDVTQHPIGRDFLNVWGAPRVAWEHGVVALADLVHYPKYLAEAFGHPLERFFNWSYPPHALLLLWPFSLPPYPVALALWTFAGLAAYAAAVAAGLPRQDRAFGAAIAAAAPATLWCVMTGQNGLILGAGLLFALLSLDRRPILAGVLFGLLTVKPQLGLLIPVALVAMGSWRTIAAAAVTATALALIAVAAFGFEPWRLWLTVTSQYQMALIEDITNFHRYLMLSIAASSFIAELPAVVGWTLQAIGSTVAVAAVWIAFRRSKDRTTRALVLLLSAALATPYAFNYDLAALTGAVVWAMAERRDMTAGERRLFGALLLLPVAIGPLHMIGLPIAPLVMLAALWILVKPLVSSAPRDAGTAAGPQDHGAAGASDEALDELTILAPSQAR